MTRPPLDSSEADIAALQDVCERLAGFDDTVSLEWLDGAMTALVAGPRLLMPAEWMPALFGDAFERAFADPEDEGRATQLLTQRWSVIASQLDPEALVDAPDTLRLAPLIAADLDDAERQRLLDDGELSEEELADLPRTGELWALGFLDAVERFPQDWVAPKPDAEDAFVHDDALGAIAALVLPDEELRADLEERYPGQTLDREELIDEACFAAQDLRVYWLDHAPKAPTRRVAAAPGRNDPCPCGSGKKFKKCHGAAADD